MRIFIKDYSRKQGPVRLYRDGAAKRPARYYDTLFHLRILRIVHKREVPCIFSRDDFSAYVDYRTILHVDKVIPHYHEGIELLYLVEGKTHILIAGKSHRAVAGDLIVYHPGVIHEERIQTGYYRIFCLRFPPDKIDLPFPKEKELQPIVRLPWRERFHNILEQLVIEKQGIDRWSDRMTGIYLMHFVILLQRALSRHHQQSAGTDEEHNRRISHVIDFVHSRIDANASLKDLASQAFMSESHFSHTFKEMTGLPPKRYQISAKIEKGCEFLATTDKKVTEIAHILGYDSSHYFNRLFKKETGSTPLEYRQKSRKVHH